jgi:hypothetical protein
MPRRERRWRHGQAVYANPSKGPFTDLFLPNDEAAGPKTVTYVSVVAICAANRFLIGGEDG